MQFLNVLLALASGVILTFAFPGWNVGIVAWLWMLPLLYALWGGDSPAPLKYRKKAWRGFGLGYLAGIAFFLPNLAWVRHSSRVIAGAKDLSWMGWQAEALGMVAALLLSLYLALYWGLWGAFAATIGKPRISRDGKPMEGDAGTLFSVSLESLRSAFLIAAAWVACEWLRGVIFTGFCWNGLGVALRQNLTLIQSADLVGVTGLSFLPVFVMGIAYNTALRFRQEIATSRVRPHADFFCAVLLMLANFGYGAWKLAQAPGATTPVKVLLVQTNVEQSVRWTPDPEGKVTAELYQDLGRLTHISMITDKPDLVIWPECALPLSFYDPNHIGFLNDVLALGDFSLLTGTDIEQPNDAIYTGAALMKGTFENFQLYRKVHLVPFGEYLPLRSVPFVETLLGSVLPGDFAHGQSTEPLTLEKPAGMQVIPLICFEDTVGRLARKFARPAPQLLVNCSNDGWFLQSIENEMHLANAIFRSIELRRPMARACNTGITSFVDTLGRVGKGDRLMDAKTGSPFIKGVLVKEVQVPADAEMTVYARYGDVFSLALLGVTVLAVGVRVVRGRAKKTAV